MYAFIQGTLTQSSQTFAIIDASGVGYKIHIGLNTASNLKEVGSQMLLHTSFVVREGFQGLYGFITIQERDLFEILIEISGVGPKIALCLIGHYSPDQLQDLILAEDTAALSKVPGIGKKTAERLLIELRNKLETFFLKNPQSIDQKNQSGPKNLKMQDALKALVHLGYNHSAAHKALKKTAAESDDLELSELISTALKHV